MLVFEEKIGWEKPCGGGLSHKAVRRYPFLAQGGRGGNFLHEAEFIAPSGAAMRFHLRTPLAVYSRATLNHLLLRRAEDAGAEIVADEFCGCGERTPAGKLKAAEKPIARILWCWRRARAPGCGRR